jgi:hypothetical protein
LAIANVSRFPGKGLSAFETDHAIRDFLKPGISLKEKQHERGIDLTWTGNWVEIGGQDGECERDYVHQAENFRREARPFDQVSPFPILGLPRG